MKEELHLKVYRDRSELIRPGGPNEVFFEGSLSSAAVLRYKKITDALSANYLVEQIKKCLDSPERLSIDDVTEDHAKLIDELVESMTSEVGRALIGLTVLQLCVKSIEPNQNIRLHKGGPGRKDFSWVDGIPMRSLDSRYITPTLRHFKLLKLNKDGFMMTRSLAENYPYSPVYKANMRGARQQWIAIVEEVEARRIKPEAALQYLLSKLINRASEFETLALETLGALARVISKNRIVDRLAVLSLIVRHMNESSYAARIMEIAMHALMQAMQESGALGGLALKPLSQMRSANKKHGNIGDIELLDGREIVESWDAKYGKSYLREELEELHEKLMLHHNVSTAGFVTTLMPERASELELRIKELEDYHDVNLTILTLGEWVDRQFELARSRRVDERTLAERWITCYAESLAQRRTDIAPIDEPCQQWLETLLSTLKAI